MVEMCFHCGDLLIVRWVVGWILYGEPIELFLVQDQKKAAVCAIQSGMLI